MDPISFGKTIYLGDRSIKGIYIDLWNRIVKIEIDLISRIRSKNGNWRFYDNEDIENGFLVFTDIYSFEINPPGAIPEEYITRFNISNYPKVIVYFDPN